MSNIFDMFEEPSPAPVTPEVKSNSGICNEIMFLAVSRGIDIPESFAKELSSLWSDPPPWSPWTN